MREFDDDDLEFDDDDLPELDLSDLDLEDEDTEDSDSKKYELKKYDVIIGDPLFKPICADKKFIELPHEAFSGRCFTKNAPNLIYTSLEDF